MTEKILGSVLYSWWIETDFQMWRRKDGYYLSDNIYSDKYKIGSSLLEAKEYLYDLYDFI